MISLRFRSILVVSIGLALAACSGDAATPTTTTPPPTTTTIAATTTSTTTTTAAPTTTTTVPPTTTTTAPDDGIPYPDNQTNDWLQVATELNNFIQWLDENPDPELVSIAYHPGTPIYERGRERYEDWVARGIRDAPGDVTETLAAEEVLYDERAGTAIINVTNQSTQSTRVDAAGDFVELGPEYPLGVSRITLYWDEDHGWRLAETRRVQVLED